MKRLLQDKIIKAFVKTPRQIFLPKERQALVNMDEPIEIGFGQTNSQPTTVFLMLKWLALEEGNKILDVGSGSGWTSALLSYLVGPQGRVVATEIIPELLFFGKKNCEVLKRENIVFQQAEKTPGWPPEAPYDRILVSAEAPELPVELAAQLKPGGKMISPIKGDIWEIFKDRNSQLKIIKHPGFVFVPLM